MRIRLESLDDIEPFVWREQLDIEPRELDDAEILELTPVEVSGTVSNRRAIGFHLEVDLGYSQKLRCTRCLRASASVPSRISFDWLVKVEAEAEASQDRELELADLETLSVTEPFIETRPLVIEQMLLSVPMKYLCREDCKGLCGQCGRDLNQSECTCRDAPDPRWAGLAALRDND